MIHGYLRVSTSQQDVNAQKHGILEYANRCGLSGISFVEDTASGKTDWRDRKIAEILKKSESGDVIVFAEISRIGRSTLQVLEFLKEAAERDIRIHIAKQGMVIDQSIQTKIIVTVLGLVADLEREFTSQRTKEGLAKAKAQGKTLGRPSGEKQEILKLDKKPGKEQIQDWINKDLGVTAVSKLAECSKHTLYTYCAARGIHLPIKRRRKNGNKNQAAG